LPFTASIISEADARRMAPGALEADVPDQAVAHVQVHREADVVERVDDLRTMSGKGRNEVAELCGRGRMTGATGGQQ
jgi:hypothetical protein